MRKWLARLWANIIVFLRAVVVFFASLPMRVVRFVVGFPKGVVRFFIAFWRELLWLPYNLKRGVMSMRLMIIDRYIIRKFLGTYLFAIGMIIVIVVIFDAAEKIDDFMQADSSLLGILTGYYLNFIPYFVNQFSGLFTFIAVIFFTSKMAYDTEIIAILSSGVSFRRLMWPYFVAAFTITSLSLLLNLMVIPEANRRRIDFENTYMNKGNSSSTLYERHIYRQIVPGTFAYIRDFDPMTNTANYFAIESYDGGRVVSSLEAENAVFDATTGRWTAPKYIQRSYEGEVETLAKSTVAMDTVVNLSSDELGRVDELIQTMNSARLSQFIDQQKEKGSDMVALFQVENYGRYAYPISTFILTLIGVALSSRKVRGGTGVHIGVGITLCFSYIVLMRFAGEFAKSGMMPAWLAIWSPNILYLFIGIYLYRKAPK